MKKLVEYVSLGLLLSCLVVPWAIFGLWWWFWTFVAIALVVIIVEIVSKIKDDMTISQKFWAFSKEHKVKAIIILTSLICGWVLLIIHLAWKMF